MLARSHADIVIRWRYPLRRVERRLLRRDARPARVFEGKDSDEALVEELRRQGGTPEEVLHSAELRRMSLDTLAADYRVGASFRHGHVDPLPIPLHALAGRDDKPQVLVETLPLPDGEKAANRPQYFAWLPDGSLLVLEAVLEGQGVALVPKPLIEADVAAGRLNLPFTIHLPSAYSYFLVVPGALAEQDTVAAFREWLHAEATALPAV